MNSPHASRITHHASRFWLPLAAAAVLLLAAPPVPAGIPMPMFVIYGTIRDTYGWPIQSGAGAIVVAQQGTNECARYVIQNPLYPGVNYMLPIYLQDSNAGANYSAKAVLPGSLVQLSVIQNGVTQSLMPASTTCLVGSPAQAVNMPLTLGTDLDGDGLPDGWEQELIAYLDDPRYRTIWDIRPNEDADGDGVSNLNEFLAGTFAFLRDDFLRIENYGTSASLFGFGFLTVPGKAYSVAQSTNLGAGTWSYPPYAQTTNGVLQTGPFSGSGDWMQVYVPRTNGFGALRLQVSP
ncbi:MAG: hypothetical protein NTX51_18895 [Verrucomicrobia bacterium]|nr:hypothetical protein [Verrucomicrobiota bacterium]